MSQRDALAAYLIYFILGALFICSLVVSNLIFQKFFYWDFFLHSSGKESWNSRELHTHRVLRVPKKHMNIVIEILSWGVYENRKPHCKSENLRAPLQLQIALTFSSVIRFWWNFFWMNGRDLFFPKHSKTSKNEC